MTRQNFSGHHSKSDIDHFINEESLKILSTVPLTPLDKTMYIEKRCADPDISSSWPSPGRYSCYRTYCTQVRAKRIEYILEWNLLEKSVKRPFCCTVSILQVYFTYLCFITFWALENHFIENLKLMLKENQIMK